MAATVVERAWRDSTPEAVEHDLAALWRELAGKGAIARAVMSNLVVFRYRERRSDRTRIAAPAERADTPEMIEQVMARHPSRAIVIEHDHGEHDPAAPIGARVGICVFGSESARYAVERIVVRSACAEASLPSIVRRFVRGDLPTSVWWTEDLSRVPPLPALTFVGRQLLYDSRQWRDIRAGIGSMAPFLDSDTDIADLNWQRLEPLRRALASVSNGGPVSPAQVRIVHRPGDGALASLLAGWLASRLRWPANEWPTIEEARYGDEVLTLFVRRDGATLKATLDSHRVVVEQPGAAPLIVAVPRSSEADAVASELRALSRDTALHDALKALAARAR